MLKRNINKKKLYWTLQTFGWGSFFIVYTSVAVAFSSFHWQIYASYINTVFFGILFTQLYRYRIKKRQWINLGLSKLAANVFLSSILIAVVWTVIILPINDTFFKIETENVNDITELGAYIVISFQFTLIMIGWSLIYFVFQFFMNFKRSEVEKWKLEAAVKDAELIALKSQINPHFIFNSLNNIRALVIEDPSKARDMITHLSDLLRYSVQFNNKEKVTIEDELEIVENYLELETIQYEDRLTYKLDVNPETLEYKIPPMAIQILVENAIKHGISQLSKGGLIHIITALEKDQLVVEVLNTGQIKSRSDSTGIGVKNVAERLDLLFGKMASFSLNNNNNNMVSAKFAIPLK